MFTDQVSAGLVEAVQVLQQRLAQPQTIYQVRHSQPVCSHCWPHLQRSARNTLDLIHYVHVRIKQMNLHHAHNDTLYSGGL